MNQYWWENINKAEKTICPTCLTCLKYKPGSLFVLLLDICIRHFNLTNGPFKFWQIDFI